MEQSFPVIAGFVRTLLKYRAVNTKNNKVINLADDTKKLKNIAFELNDNIRKQHHADLIYIATKGEFQGIPLFLFRREDNTFVKDLAGTRWLPKDETGVIVRLLEKDGNINILEFNMPISLFYKELE